MGRRWGLVTTCSLGGLGLGRDGKRLADARRQQPRGVELRGRIPRRRRRTEAMTVTTRLRATLALLLVSAPVLAAAARAYPDPTAAVDALVAAARSGDPRSVAGVLGDRSKSFLVSDDPVSDRAALARFVEL